MRRVCIAPGAIDSNKGDQALIATCIILCRQIFGENADIGVIGAAEPGEDIKQGELRHTRRLGVKLFNSILHSPRREKLERAGAEDTFHVKLCMTFNAVADFLWSLILLFICQNKRFASVFLKGSKQKTFDFLSSSDYLFIKGGGFIYAYRGLRYYYYLYFQLYLIMLAQRLRIKVMIMPNSFGPFDTKFGCYLTRRVLNKCTVVATRELISTQRLLDIRVDEERIRSLPDMAFTLEPIEKSQAESKLKKAGIDRLERLVGFTVRPWRFPGCSDPARAWSNYIDSIVSLSRHVKSKSYTPVFFPQSIGPHDHEDDRIAIREVLKRLGDEGVFFVNGDWLPQELAGMYGLMDFFVGTRMHSVIFAMLGAVPVIAISYQGPKAQGIMEQALLSDYVINIDSVTPNALQEMFDHLSADKNSVVEKIQLAVKKFGHQLDEFKCEIIEKF